jgi:hypothetical protein
MEPNTSSPGRTLLLAFLTIAGSYIERREQPAGAVPDTVQFWLDEDGVWRVRTYALDHDIHVHHLVGALDSQGKPRVPMLRAHLERAYPDALGAVYELEFANYLDAEEVARVLAAAGLPRTALEPAEAGFYFYNPDGGEYKSLSEPA